MKHNFKKIESVYTGGGIWLFHGELKNGRYFLVDDMGDVVILNTDPSDFDVSLYYEWQQEHMVKELEKKERWNFCLTMLKLLMKNDECAKRNGLGDHEIDYYTRYMMDENR